MLLLLQLFPLWSLTPGFPRLMTQLYLSCFPLKKTTFRNVIMQQYETNIQYRVKDIMRPLRNKCILFVTNLSSLEILAKTSRNLKEQLFVGAHLRIRVWCKCKKQRRLLLRNMMFLEVEEDLRLITLSYSTCRTLIVLLLVHYEWHQHVKRSKSPSFSILIAYFLPLSTKSHIPSSLKAFTASPRFLSRKKGSACQSKIRLLSPPLL